MAIIDLAIWLLVGAFAGWVASKIMNTDASMGAVANIVVGILGAVIGGFLAGLFGISVDKGEINFVSIVTAILGAVVLLWLVKLFSGRRV